MDVILVDEKDNQIGVKEKLAAHKSGELHRAFSVFIFNSRNELLLQKRAIGKYHSAGLWTNTCCSHPGPGKSIREEAENRLFEEMGIRCSLTKKFNFVYKAVFNNGLTEHEYDHVFFGYHDKEPVINKNEASDWKWLSLESLKKDIHNHPEKYTFWLKSCLEKVIEIK